MAIVSAYSALEYCSCKRTLKCRCEMRFTMFLETRALKLKAARCNFLCKTSFIPVVRNWVQNVQNKYGFEFQPLHRSHRKYSSEFRITIICTPTNEMSSQMKILESQVWTESWNCRYKMGSTRASIKPALYFQSKVDLSFWVLHGLSLLKRPF